MTLAKTIELLNFLILQGFGPTQDDTKDAIKIGIEALKRLKHERLIGDKFAAQPLPGETED